MGLLRDGINANALRGKTMQDDKEMRDEIEKKAKVRATLFDAGIDPYTEEGEELVKKLMDKTPVFIPSVFGPPPKPTPCPKCKGTGKQFNFNKCKQCNGTGEAPFWIASD
jgi:hypothetical protein